ncbi:hypothetical protein CASFOL_041219 [Castilleja foliolosa]|uniref:F-box domain-containing protein n=1 Tax=Castilleja foliolosa TaxID=1961234 RepID=A0ABD3BEB5_9LAMI
MNGVMENTKTLNTIEDENNSEITGSDNCEVTNIVSLPENVMFEILVRVPAQDIYHTAGLVCPSWHKITRTHDFVRAHLRQSTYGLLIQNRVLVFDVLVFVATPKDQIEVSKFNIGLNQREILSSCNGLVLLYLNDNKSDLYISNPAIKRRYCNDGIAYAAMAYVAASMEYKVVRTTFSHNQRPRLQFCSILTVGVDKDWTRCVNIQHLPMTAEKLLFSVQPLTTEGFVHWARTNDSEYVLTLNMETEIITLHHVPSHVRRHHDGETKLSCRYLSTGSHLSMLIGDHARWKVWMMKPETGEWTNDVTSIDLEDEKCTFEVEEVSVLNCRVEPVGWSEFGEVLVFKVRTTIFDPNSRSLRIPYNICHHYGSFCITYNVCTREIDSFKLECHESDNYIAHKISLVWLDQPGEEDVDADDIDDLWD